MSKVLIAYYSRTGTVRQAAQQLQQITGWPIGEVRDRRSRAGLVGELRCVLDAVFGRSAPYEFVGPAVEGFDRVVVLAPVWLDGLASPMRALLIDRCAGDAAQPGRPVSLVCVMSRLGAFRAADEITTIVGAAPAPVLALTQADVLSGQSRAALQALADEIAALDAEVAVTRPMGLSRAAA